MRFSIICFGLILSALSLQGQWIDNHVSIGFDVCTGELEMTFRVEQGYFDCNDSDRIGYFTAFYPNGGQDVPFFHIFDKNQNGVHYAVASILFTSSYLNQGGFQVLDINPPGHCSGYLILMPHGATFTFPPSGGGNGTFKWRGLPGTIDNQLLNIQLSGHWDYYFGGGENFGPDQGNGIFPTNITNSGANSSFPNLNATSNSCDNVTLTWSGISGLPGCGNRSIEIQKAVQGTNDWEPTIPISLSISSTTYVDANATKGVSTKYRIRHRFAPSSDRVIYSNWTETSSTSPGLRIGKLSPPTSVTASKGGCQDYIEVGWSWTNPETFLGGWNVERRIKSPVGTWEQIASNLLPGQRVYQDLIDDASPVVPNVEYEYRVFSINTCSPGDISDASAEPYAFGIGPGKPNAPIVTNAVTHNGSNKKITLQWSYTPTPVDKGFIVIRQGGPAPITTNINDVNAREFEDLQVHECVQYTYVVKAKSECLTGDDAVGISSFSTTINPDLSNTFETGEFKASKGIYPDRVQLEWTNNNSSVITNIRIYRRILGTTDYTNIATLPSNSSIYNDLTADAGKLFEYQIEAIADCDGTNVLSPRSDAVGFRIKSGLVSGKVAYEGSTAIAVKDVKIIGESTDGIVGGGLDISSGGLTIAQKASQAPASDYNIEMWLRPDNYNSNFDVFNMDGVFKLSYDHSTLQYVATATGTSSVQSASIPSDSVAVGKWSHLASHVTNDTLYIRVNGMVLGKTALSNNFQFEAPTVNPIRLLTNYDGAVTEIRAWTAPLTATEMFRNHSRFVVGNETGLSFLFPLTEGAGDNAYDRSRISSTTFNENHANITGTHMWLTSSSSLPNSDQLSYAGYTDINGDYTIGLPYSSVGSNYRLTPKFQTHQFSPGNKLLFIGEGSSVINGVNFEDLSKFRVTGALTFDGTDCPVEGAFIKVDGEFIRDADGNAVLSDAAGEYDILVPIGEHSISVQKAGHSFKEGRFPPSGFEDFQFPRTNVDFIDSTKVVVVGRVVGGLREKSKKIGFHQSKNNIGQARVILKSQLLDGCATDTAFTNSQSGEYRLAVPPLKYIPNVSIDKNPTSFGTAVLNYDETPLHQVSTDTIFDQTGAVFGVDSVSYNHRKDFIKINEAIIVATDKDGVSDFIGDTTLVYTDVNGAVTERDLRLDPLPWPVFSSGTGVNGKKYKMMVKVYEPYVNYDNAIPVYDSVPTTDGIITVTNYLADSTSYPIEMNKINSLDTLRSLIVEFNVGDPNFSENTIEKYSYTKRLELSYKPTGGAPKFWEPSYLPNISPMDADKSYRGYVLGLRELGTRYFTEGPQRPEFILRDPPGSGSSATREVGSSSKFERSWSWNLGSSASTEDKINVGADFAVGLGLQVRTKIASDNTFGFAAEIKGGRAGSVSEEVTLSKAMSTSSTTDLVGAGSDVYIGKSQNIEFGATEHLRLVPISACAEIACIGSNIDGYSFASTTGLSLAPEGYTTNFAFSQGYIINYLLPLLTDVRDALLQDPTKYTSHKSVEDALYGVNNDDPTLSNPVDCMGLTPCFASLSGPSYTYHAMNGQDSIQGDSVRFINNQMKLWEDAIALNEWEKSVVGDQQVIDSIYQLEKQKLLDEYAGDIAAQAITGAITLAAVVPIAYGTIVTPVPGTAAAGLITFGITTAAGIANAETASRYEEFLLKLGRLDAKFDRHRELITTPTNYSLSSGVSISESVSTSAATSSSGSIEYNVAAAFKIEVKAEVNGTGFGFEKGFTTKFEYGRDWGEEESESESVSFTISDDDQPDYFSVDVYPSILGWGPVFKKRDGGQTSCPFEDAEYSLFYREDNQPVKISGKTNQIDVPVLEVAPTVKITNVPSNQAAVFTLSLKNESEAFAAREYRLQTLSSSNPYGAIVRYDGGVGGSTVAIAGDQTVTKTITISKPPGPRLSFDSIIIVMFAPCQYEAGTSDNLDIVDSVYVSVEFLPDCTPVRIFEPTDQWVLNNSLNDTMPITMVDYDINYGEFERLLLQYKPNEEPAWIDLQSFWVDTTGFNDPKAIPIPRNSPFTRWDWPVKQITDGPYDLRVISECLQANTESDIHRGYMDRINPHAFGSPSPADGVLDPNDDILLTLNETVDIGSITKKGNFSITGVLNGTELANETSIAFDGVEGYGVIPEYQLQNRSLSLEFWMRRTSLSGSKEMIFSQGIASDDQLSVAITENDVLEFKVGNKTIKSTSKIDNQDWYHCAFIYDRDSSKTRIYLAHDTRSFNSPDARSTGFGTNYSGDGNIFIAKDAAGQGAPFSGAIREMRLWSTVRTEGEITVQMSRVLSGREPGLIGNWPMGEAIGSVARDKVRSRHMEIVKGTWSILPQNHAYEFDGTDDYLVADSAGTLAFGIEADITIEAWFKTSSTSTQTILSNGRSDGTQNLSSYWSVYMNPAGAIVLENDGNTVSTPGGYNNGTWHHVSAVVERTRAISIYIDGDLVVTGNASAFTNFAGPKIWIGCRGWIQSAPLMQNRDQFWNGSLDDIRVWNLARRPEQVKRDFVHQQDGDELALMAYYPFDGIVIQNNQRLRVPDNLDASENNYNLSLGLGQSLNYVIDAPPVKLPRLVSGVNFDYSINNDQIFFDLDELPAAIENVTLDITVQDLKDISGNKMADSETWIAYINKNQVFWEEEYFQFEKKLEDNLSFKAKIKNTGGSQESYSLANLPSWLSASPSSGLIDPNSTIEVTFSVQPLLNIGEYEQDIYVSTESFGFNERLLLDLKVIVDPPEWIVAPASFSHSMSIVGQFEINDVISTDPEDMVSVWVHDKLRGVTHVEFDPSSGKHLVFLDVYSNVTTGEVLEFRAWDASRGRLLKGLMPDDIAYIGGGIIGSRGNPIPIEATVLTQLQYVLTPGWNWISFPLASTVLGDINQALVELSPTENDQMKYPGKEHTYSGGSWRGEEALTTNRGYKIRVAKADTFRYEGTFMDPSLPLEVMQIDSGWNWIGVKSEFIIDVPSAMASLDPQTGDVIKGQRTFAIYEDGFGWGGSLDFLQPQKGYMLKYHTSDQLIYPGNLNARSRPETRLKSRSQKGKEYAQLEKSLNYETGKYSNTMSLIAEIDACIALNAGDVELDLSQWSLVAHAGDECRGVVESTWQSSTGTYVYYLSIEGSSAVDLQFQLVHNTNGGKISLSQTMEYASNGVVGMNSAPYQFTCVADDCIESSLFQSGDVDMSQTVMDQRVMTDLRSDAILPSDRIYRFRAGNSIELILGFEVTEGATLEAYIEDCITTKK